MATMRTVRSYLRYSWFSPAKFFCFHSTFQCVSMEETMESEHGMRPGWGRHRSHAPHWQGHQQAHCRSPLRPPHRARQGWRWVTVGDEDGWLRGWRWMRKKSRVILQLPSARDPSMQPILGEWPYNGVVASTHVLGHETRLSSREGEATARPSSGREED
jgi:hypothetical protein